MKRRLPAALLLQLILVQHAAQSDTDVIVPCNQDAVLPCPGMETGLDFIGVTWYKVESSGNFGIIRFSKGQSEPKRYNFRRPSSFGERHSLRLGGVTPEDAGLYECEISANIGGQNRNLRVELTVGECVTQPETTLAGATAALNFTLPGAGCGLQSTDVPVLWSSAGYVALALLKIALSLISVWIIHRRTSGSKSARWSG